jgi:hypothetical protein
MILTNGSGKTLIDGRDLLYRKYSEVTWNNVGIYTKTRVGLYIFYNVLCHFIYKIALGNYLMPTQIL